MDDLYGDLDTSTDALERTEALRRESKVEQDNARLQQELALLQRANQQLGKANAVLETNISTLFSTAQLEIKRKDKEILRLRAQVEQLTRRT